MRYIAIFALLISSLAIKTSIAFGDEVTTEDGYIAVEESSTEPVKSVPESASAELAVHEKPAAAEPKEKLATNEYGSTASDAASVLGTSYRYSAKKPGSQYSLTPTVGGSFYTGRWSDHIGNAYTLGLILERRFSGSISAELEGTYGSYTITYSGILHDFGKIAVGLNAKVYVLTGTLRPYLGAGLLAIHYENMFSGLNRYNQWVGAPQLLLGAEYQITNGVDVGLRTAWVLPAINVPETRATAAGSLPGFEEAAAIGENYFKVMGTVKIGL